MNLSSGNATSNDSGDDSDKSSESEGEPSDDDRMFLRARLQHNRSSIIEYLLVDSGSKRNLISYQTLKRLGHKMPKIKPSSINLSGANGEPLFSIGICKLTLYVGNRHFNVPFHVCRNLATYALLGRKSLKRKLKAKIDFEKEIMTLGNDESIPLIKPATHDDLKIFNRSNVVIEPHQRQFITCHKPKHCKVRGTYVSSPNPRFENEMVSNVFEVRGKRTFDILAVNTSDRPLHIPKNTLLGTMRPVVGNYQLQDVSADQLSDLYDVNYSLHLSVYNLW